MTETSSRQPLLEQRMESLSLSPARVEKNSPAIMRDLQHSCSSCAVKSQCALDLAHKRAAAVAEYCPNEQTLQLLRKT